jgi:3-hydroxyisobutyrate dehydrogenase-like beta-hydroxyacid dehydrogenase
MFENRVPHMLDNDYTPYSALDIFVKDLGIVTREGSSRKVPLHISTVAHQLFLAGILQSFNCSQFILHVHHFCPTFLTIQIII